MATGFNCPACNCYIAESLVPGQQSKCPFCGQAIVIAQLQSQQQPEQPQHIFCAKCGIKNAANNYQCESCGFVLRSQRPYVVTSEDGLGGLIPYRNSHALWAYYLGIFSLIPCFGLFPSVPAFILGIKGLKKARQQPEVKGKVHAIIGIVLGSLCFLFNISGLVLVIIGAMSKH